MTPRVLGCLTFDYEIAFGENLVTPQAMLIDPAYQIQQTIQKAGGNATWFVDILSLAAHDAADVDPDIYSKPVRAQITQFSAAKEAVELHIHPHWPTSYWSADEQRWKFDMSRFSLNHIEQSDGIDAVRAIIGEADRQIKVFNPTASCFRAGGWSLGDSQAVVMQELQMLGYRTDSSVRPFSSYISDYHRYDYRTAPLDSWYPITPQAGLLAVQEHGPMLELPVVALPATLGNKVRDLAYKVYKRRNPQAALERAAIDKNVRGHGARVKGTAIDNGIRFSLDAITMHDFPRIRWVLDSYINHCQQETCIITVVGHPKSMFQSSIEVMQAMMQHLQDRYQAEFVSQATATSTVMQ